MTEHPITPPPELVQQWWDGTHGALYEFEAVVIQAARWGADMELSECCKWLPNLPPWSADDLRKHRRPKPPSLKELAMKALDEAVYMADDIPPEGISTDQADIIRRAIESLPD